MHFEWDPDKNAKNKKKHGVSFETAVKVFLDEKRIERLDEEHSSWYEERSIIIGRVSRTLILFVVSTDRNGITRLISARKAEKEEEDVYYENYDAR